MHGPIIVYQLFKFFLANFQGGVANTVTSVQLHKRAERIAQMLTDNNRLSSGDNIALLYPPGKWTIHEIGTGNYIYLHS